MICITNHTIGERRSQGTGWSGCCGRRHSRGGHTEFYQLSHGMRLHWSRAEQAFQKLTLNGSPLSAQGRYSVALQKYHFMNLKKFLDLSLEEVEANRKVKVLATSYVDVLEEYIAAHQHLSRAVEGRIVVS